MLNRKTKKLVLNKQTVSILKKHEMALVKGGDQWPTVANGSKLFCEPGQSMFGCQSCIGGMDGGVWCPINTYCDGGITF
jgi:hypothetical protein